MPEKKDIVAGLLRVPGPGDLCPNANNPLVRFGPGRDKLNYAMQVSQIHDYRADAAQPWPSDAPASATYTPGWRNQSPSRTTPRSSNAPVLHVGLVQEQ